MVHILAVDDDNEVLETVGRVLRHEAYEVSLASSAAQALTFLDKRIPDLMILDVLMPQMDGNELVRRAKQLHPGLPAMIISGTVNAFDRALHADVFLPKGGCSAAEMIERIRVLVARKRGPKKTATATSTQWRR